MAAAVAFAARALTLRPGDSAVVAHALYVHGNALLHMGHVVRPYIHSLLLPTFPVLLKRHGDSDASAAAAIVRCMSEVLAACDWEPKAVAALLGLLPQVTAGEGLHRGYCWWQAHLERDL